MAKNIETDKVVDDKGTKVEIITARRPAHEVARWMLEVNPYAYAIPLAAMYGEQETEVPSTGIPVLVETFKTAKEIVVKHIDRAIAVLEKQQEEAIQKKQEKEKD